MVKFRSQSNLRSPRYGAEQDHMETREYLKLLGRQLAHELTAHDKIRTFVGSHPDLIGDYAEASTRDFISRVVTPLKVSTGTILYEGNIGNPPQLDAIVWSPIVGPAIFENANFAIVPRGNAHGYLEIKSMSYSSKVGKDIAQKLAHEEKLIQPHLKDLKNFFPQLKDAVGALGVVCVATKPDKTLRRLVEEKRAVILLDMDNGELEPNPAGIWTLVNYLLGLRLRAIACEGRLRVNSQLISSDEPQPKPTKQRHSQARKAKSRG
jgi:hypothetical protein